MTVWVGRDLYHLDPPPPPAIGQGHLPLDQVPPSPIPMPAYEKARGHRKFGTFIYATDFSQKERKPKIIIIKKKKTKTPKPKKQSTTAGCVWYNPHQTRPSSAPPPPRVIHVPSMRTFIKGKNKSTTRTCNTNKHYPS